MRRRDLPSALLSTAAGGTVIGRAAQNAGPALSGPTRAELSAEVTPAHAEYIEGDIRRYGATIASFDNSQAINHALKVSAHGGNAGFIPGGTWKIASSLRAVGVSSLRGEGNCSIIAPQDCDALIFESSGDYSITGTARFFRDFQIVGGNTSSSSRRAIVVDFSVASRSRVTGVQFQNLYIANFGTGAYLRGLWNSSFDNCFFYNNYYGLYFYGQTIRTTVTNCTIERGSITGSGGSWGISFQTVDGESTESTQIVSTYCFLYDININVLLAFELQMVHCDLSAAQLIGVHITSTNGGCWIRDCWIETDAPVPTTGIEVADIKPTTTTSIHIIGNHINCDVAHAGSQGIKIGRTNAGTVIQDNAVVGFDQGITLGASNNLICKFNRIGCATAAYSGSSYAIKLDSLAANNEIGPNYILPGLAARAVATGGTEIQVGAAGGFPRGSPVQFDTSAHGFASGVTYFVVDSSDTSITLTSVAGGAPISASGSGAIGNVFAAPLPLVLTAGTPPGLAFYGRGKFIMTLSSGFSEARLPGGIAEWVANGGCVSIMVHGRGLSGISNSLGMQASGIPVFLRPATEQQLLASVTDDGVSIYGLAVLSPAGALSFYKTPALGVFSANGVKGVNAMPLTYIIG